jgi:hypothetical protein
LYVSDVCAWEAEKVFVEGQREADGDSNAVVCRESDEEAEELEHVEGL